jgi:hypothetical protein
MKALKCQAPKNSSSFGTKIKVVGEGRLSHRGFLPKSESGFKCSFSGDAHVHGPPSRQHRASGGGGGGGRGGGGWGCV